MARENSWVDRAWQWVYDGLEGIRMTWEGCEAVERVAGKMSGQPVIKGTRVLADTIVCNLEGGSSVDEIAENYPHVPEEAIRKVIAFYERQHQLVP